MGKTTAPHRKLKAQKALALQTKNDFLLTLQQERFKEQSKMCKPKHIHKKSNSLYLQQDGQCLSHRNVQLVVIKKKLFLDYWPFIVPLIPFNLYIFKFIYILDELNGGYNHRSVSCCSSFVCNIYTASCHVFDYTILQFIFHYIFHLIKFCQRETCKSPLKDLNWTGTVKAHGRKRNL